MGRQYHRGKGRSNSERFQAISALRKCPCGSTRMKSQSLTGCSCSEGSEHRTPNACLKIHFLCKQQSTIVVGSCRPVACSLAALLPDSYYEVFSSCLPVLPEVMTSKFHLTLSHKKKNEDHRVKNNDDYIY